MKKLIFLLLILGTLSSCARRNNCPAYGNTQKNTPSQATDK
ncbi:MAG: hypothetical protein U0Y10_00760 [Spirosomataceae bacterium]